MEVRNAANTMLQTGLQVRYRTTSAISPRKKNGLKKARSRGQRARKDLSTGFYRETIVINRTSDQQFRACSFYLYMCKVSVCLSVRLSICLSVCLSVYLSVCLYVCMFVCLYVCLSVYMHVVSVCGHVIGVNPGGWRVAPPYFGLGVVGSQGSRGGREALLQPILHRKYVRKWSVFKKMRTICPECSCKW